MQDRLTLESLHAYFNHFEPSSIRKTFNFKGKTAQNSQSNGVDF